MNDTAKNFWTAAGLDVAAVTFVDWFKSKGGVHAEKMLEGWIAGLGVNDEVLFQSACSYAHWEMKVPVNDINKVSRVINSYPNSIRERIIEVIGKTEQETTITEPATDRNGAVITGQTKQTKCVANTKGAQTIALLAKMTPPEIRTFFKASGATNTVGSKLQATGKKLKKTLQPGIDGLNDFATSVENRINTQTPLRDFFNAIRR